MNRYTVARNTVEDQDQVSTPLWFRLIGRRIVEEEQGGDAVNLAFRFESASKTLDTDIVIGPDAYQNLTEGFWKGRCRSVNVKGRDGPILVWPVRFAEARAMLDQLGM